MLQCGKGVGEAKCVLCVWVELGSYCLPCWLPLSWSFSESRICYGFLSAPRSPGLQIVGPRSGTWEPRRKPRTPLAGQPSPLFGISYTMSEVLLCLVGNWDEYVLSTFLEAGGCSLSFSDD